MEKSLFSDHVDEIGYDAVVVGSGYGGSVAACRMSMAGINVCLVEKGRKWEAQDFPTDSLKIISAFRIENKSLGFSFGPKDALFQVYEQDNCVAAIANGLGGGSLINAGVMIPTPIRVKRNPNWPKEWEKDWELCESSASSMLRTQNVPMNFPNTKITDEILKEEEIDGISKNSIKLSINFDGEDSQSKKSNCLACGNCLSGCPYNAKNSTDKTYISSAIQAGCTVKTKCQIQYIVENPDNICIDEIISKKRQRRRWLVFFDETDYITCDFVVLSGGVLGTVDVLFQSQMRGLQLSERLGFGFSCNGNNVAYLADSPAPFGSYGLDKNKLSKVPFQDRPGPSISSSYTSSLGFTIQKAVVPIAYTPLLFKGVITYGWPNGFSLVHEIIDKLKHALGFKSSQAMILCAIGHDNNDGKITFDKETNKISFYPPNDPLLSRKLEIFQKLTRKLGGNLYMSKYRSTSVHLLGGCNASSDPLNGVCNPNGQVLNPKSTNSVHQGLYVCDASLIPCSIGTNPCLTIATIAEHISRHLVKDVLTYNIGSGPIIKTIDVDEHKSLVEIKETLRGYIGGMPCVAHLKMKMNSLIEKKYDKQDHVSEIFNELLRGKVGGYVVFRGVEQDKLHVILGEVDLFEVDNRNPYMRFMHYRLLLAASSGSRYIFEGKKTLNPYLFGLYAWRETTTMHVTFKKIATKGSKEEMISLKGELRISMFGLLKTLITLKGVNKGKFLYIFMQSLLRTYILQKTWVHHKDFNPLEIQERPYPNSTIHEIKTEDGFITSCRQWKCDASLLRVEEEKKKRPVFLLNGYSNESYWLPTEPNDLVRTLLKEGHETWLLQPRLHPLNCSNKFTIDDIGRYDIPAAINKIQQVLGAETRVHVVAHCVGGLSIHIAIMGGHVSATDHLASLCCTNSSMFFKLTASSKFKMWLPLIPISMVLLGENTILPLFTTLKSSLRHRLLKSIARVIPRYERCTYDECEVFSGIFGNAFWHDNISPSMHYWLNKKNLPILPLSGFPHLRKICNSGFVVDENGKNTYLIHPEKMAVPTKYISGGRNLLVTPETSFLANKYMKLHQPGFRHERVVVDGFGHSDLLIGEESYIKVFPHILSHIKLAESEKDTTNNNNRGYSKKSLDWSNDYYMYEGYYNNCWIYALVGMFLLLLHYLF